MDNLPEHIKILQEKLNDFRAAHARTADGAHRFELKKSIEQAEEELKDAFEKYENLQIRQNIHRSKKGLSAKYYPYTCDRVDQRDIFIENNLTKKARKVHFFYLHGETPQSHKGMFKRLHYEIKSIDPGKRSLKNDLHDFPIINESNKELIYKKEILEALFRYFGLDLNNYSQYELDELRLKHICDDSPALKGYSAKNHVAVMFFIVSSKWKPFTKNLIKWFIDGFCAPGEIPETAPTFFFFLAVAYQEKRRKKNLLFKFFSKPGEAARDKLKAIAKEIREVVWLPELNEVKKEDVDTWFTKNNLNLAATQKQKIYNKYFNTSGPYDMEDVIEALNEAVNTHNENLIVHEKL